MFYLTDPQEKYIFQDHLLSASVYVCGCVFVCASRSAMLQLSVTLWIFHHEPMTNPFKLSGISNLNVLHRRFHQLNPLRDLLHPITTLVLIILPLIFHYSHHSHSYSWYNIDSNILLTSNDILQAQHLLLQFMPTAFTKQFISNQSLLLKM